MQILGWDLVPAPIPMDSWRVRPEQPPTKADTRGKRMMLRGKKEEHGVMGNPPSHLMGSHTRKKSVISISLIPYTLNPHVVPRVSGGPCSRSSVVQETTELRLLCVAPPQTPPSPFENQSSGRSLRPGGPCTITITPQLCGRAPRPYS